MIQPNGPNSQLLSSQKFIKMVILNMMLGLFANLINYCSLTSRLSNLSFVGLKVVAVDLLNVVLTYNVDGQSIAFFINVFLVNSISLVLDDLFSQ